MFMNTRAELTAAKKMAAMVEPTTVPRPPRIETPPMTDAVMIVSSRLLARMFHKPAA